MFTIKLFVYTALFYGIGVTAFVLWYIARQLKGGVTDAVNGKHKRMADCNRSFTRR